MQISVRILHRNTESSSGLVTYIDKLESDKQKFNYVLSFSHCSIERTFSLLKGKFWRLKYLDVNDLSEVPNVTVTACTLHNFILQNDGKQVMKQFLLKTQLILLHSQKHPLPLLLERLPKYEMN